MVKLLEDSTYIYSVSAIKTAPLHFNPQAENATEEIMDRVIAHINMFSKHMLYFCRQISQRGDVKRQSYV